MHQTSAVRLGNLAHLYIKYYVEEYLGDCHIMYNNYAIRSMHVLHSKSLYLFSAEPAHIDKAKEIVKKMTFNYQSDAFENPGNGGGLCRIVYYLLSIRVYIPGV